MNETVLAEAVPTRPIEESDGAFYVIILIGLVCFSAVLICSIYGATNNWSLSQILTVCGFEGIASAVALVLYGQILKYKVPSRTVTFVSKTFIRP